jgi:hypothetical protein
MCCSAADNQQQLCCSIQEADTRTQEGRHQQQLEHARSLQRFSARYLSPGSTELGGLTGITSSTVKDNFDRFLQELAELEDLQLPSCQQNRVCDATHHLAAATLQQLKQVSLF